MTSRARVSLVQRLLPKDLISAVTYRIARSERRWISRPLIRWFAGTYGVDLAEAEHADFDGYPTFNAFFTRALKPDARPMPEDTRTFLCPADGKVSQVGAITSGPDGDSRIFQAKGIDFSVGELLGDEISAAPYRNGNFITVYLSPRDYHRVHMPLAGTLRETVHIPGRLFSVAPFSVDAVPRLFARNERLVCHFEGDHGPFAVVLVGAMLVSSVSTVWGGLEIPPYGNGITRRTWRDRSIRLERGTELGRFNMGSTVIVAVPPNRVVWGPALASQTPVLVRQAIGRSCN